MEENKKSNKGWVIALAILSILAIGANALQFFGGKKAPELQTEQTNEDMVDEAVEDTEALITNLENERDVAVNHIDSLEMELSYWKSEIERVKQASSGGNAMSNQERNRLLGQISNLRSRIAAFAYKEQLLDSLTQQNLAYELAQAQKSDSLNSLLSRVDSLSSSVNQLNSAKQNLESKISDAGKPVFSPIKVYGTDKKKSSDRTSYDASKIESLHVEYRLIGNSLFEGNLKEELKVRVTGPSGELYLKGGDIIEKSRQEDFTWLEEFTYTGSSKSFKQSFIPKKKLPKGKYKVELFENGQPVQEVEFSLY